MSDPPSRPATARLAPYFAEAAAWSRDVHGAFGRSRRAAWLVAGAAVLVAASEGAALITLGPIRRGVAYVIPVDAQRNRALAVQPLAAGPLQDDPAFTQSMLARYVAAREAFDATRLRRDFTLVEQLSDRAMQREYAVSLSKTSPASPLQLYTPRAVLEVEIRSISLLDPGMALVRFETRRADLAGAQPEPSSATVSFAYTRAGMRGEDRWADPLGFQVTAYRKVPG